MISACLLLRSRRLLAAVLMLVFPLTSPSLAGEQEAIDGCIDRLRAVAGAGGGQVLSSEFSEAATIVMLSDARGAVWRCRAYSDGSVGDLSRVQAGIPGSGQGTRVQVTGIASNDVLNVRSGAGTGYRVIGALANGDVVRQLRCQNVGSALWCEVRMPGDMGGRGWVNARYLTSGSAVQQPSPPSGSQRVRFPTGASGTSFTDSLLPQQSRRYVLGASNGQFFNFRLQANGPGMTYRILNPDGSELLSTMPARQSYRGQLWQSGDHVVEVRNTANGAQSFTLVFGID